MRDGELSRLLEEVPYEAIHLAPNAPYWLPNQLLTVTTPPEQISAGHASESEPCGVTIWTWRPPTWQRLHDISGIDRTAWNDAQQRRFFDRGDLILRPVPREFPPVEQDLGALGSIVQTVEFRVVGADQLRRAVVQNLAGGVASDVPLLWCDHAVLHPALPAHPGPAVGRRIRHGMEIQVTANAYGTMLRWANTEDVALLDFVSRDRKAAIEAASSVEDIQRLLHSWGQLPGRLVWTDWGWELRVPQLDQGEHILLYLVIDEARWELPPDLARPGRS